ncbi:MAG: phosphoribosyltransferase family protein [Alphaproteobacteria bacterium]|nr:phosphoribosyltransferase family protein [Alphaproteobacteria bacterium]
MRWGIFEDRKDAGQRLAAALARFRDEAPVVLALPRGGLPVALEVALVLNAPLDIVLVRKIGAPQQPELAVAAVVDGEHPEMAVNEELVRILRLSKEFLDDAKAKELAEIERRRKLYLGDRPRAEIKDKTAIVIDDGIATGATARAALMAVRRAGARRVVLAVPVAPPQTVEWLRQEADEVVCLEQPPELGAIGAYYVNFGQLSDDDVVQCLNRAAAAYDKARGN